MKKIKLLTLIAALFVMPAKSFADFALPLSLTYLSDTLKTSTTTTTGNYLGANVAFGYILPAAPLFLGATYDYLDYGGTATGKYTQTSYGPTVGVMTGNLHFLATYIFSSQTDLKDTGQSGNAYKKGSGFLLNLGYTFDFGTVSFGPSIVYKTVKYTELTSGSTTFTTDFTMEKITPYLTVAFKF